MDWLDTNIVWQSFYDFNEIDKHDEYILFGASLLGGYISKILLQNNYNIKYFCDNNPRLTGNTVNSIKVISIDELKEKDKKIPIIVTSHFAKEICVQLTGMGFQNIFPPKRHIGAGTINMEELILSSKDKINSVISMLEDEKSVYTYKNVINFRSSNNLQYINNACDKDNPQYFDKAIIKLTDNETFIDCGAYNGGNTKYFLSQVNNKYNKVYVFEPDKTNYEITANNLKDNERVFCFNKGIGDTCETLKFSSLASGSSKFSDEGSCFVQTDYLDNILEEATFIKMDIEGYEIKGLLGAKNIIGKYKPKLAICIYHNTSDLWEIPLLVKKLNKNYRLFIRHYYPHMEFETVCYCI